MDSPLRDQGVSAATNDLQGSPFFKYLCSLSPIKQAKQVHVAQTYSELTFPPPPTVFVSPPLALQKAVGVYRNYKAHECSQKSGILGDGKEQILVAGSVVEHSKRLFLPLSEVQHASSFSHVSEFASAACTKGYDMSFVGTMLGDNDRLTTHHQDCSISEGNSGAKIGLHRSLAHYSDLESAQPSDARDSGNEKKDSQILVPSLSLSNDEPCSSGNSFASQQNDLKKLEMKMVYDTSDLTMDERSNVEPNVHVEKGGNLNHRVVRRRCLDFAASEARRLSGCMDNAAEYSPSSAQYSLANGSAMFDSSFEIGGTSPKAQITSPLSDEALGLVLKPITSKTLADADQHSGGSLSSEIHSSVGLHLDSLSVGLQIQQWDGKSQGGPDHQSPASLHEVAESPDSPKRRKLSTTVEKPGDGCKRCKCKKSRCLKLYCECFAAGVYCVDSCTCRDCFNKPDYEETVLGTRQQIESRNPLAFAPKIIRAAEPSPIEGDDSANTPASARHKRGCNCKKSLCLKKYCECYQAGVGCSEDCRCEGCKNVHGKKEGQDEEEEEKDPVDVCDKDHGSDQSDLAKTEKSSCKELSPITPTFEKVWHGKSTGTKCGRKRSTEQLQSPLSNISIPKFPRSPSKSTKLTPLSYAVSTPFISRCISEAPSLIKSSMSPRSISKISQLSPRWDVLDDICTLTPLPQHPTRPIPSTADSGTTASCYSQNTRTSDVYIVEDAMPFRQPNLQDTPTTPLPSASQFIVSDDMAEDVRRPGLLKIIEVVSESPLRTAMITCSPKRKRVTPPRNLDSKI